MGKFTPEEIVARREARRAARRAVNQVVEIQRQRNTKRVKILTISIEWRKSRTWGSTPHAEAQVSYHDGTCQHLGGYTCGGCGYDKESTVIAKIFDDFLRYKLWNRKPLTNAPYGVRYSTSGQYGESVSFEGGVGTSCYYKIAEFIGGTFAHTASGKTFDVFTYTDGEFSE